MRKKKSQPKVIIGQWRVHTPNLLKEIGLLSSKGAGVLRIPLNIFGRILADVGTRASELDDPELNQLMCRLTIYAEADPESEHYNKDMPEKALSFKPKKKK